MPNICDLCGLMVDEAREESVEPKGVMGEVLCGVESSELRSVDSLDPLSHPQLRNYFTNRIPSRSSYME